MQNSVQLIGNIGNIETQGIQGRNLATVSLATNASYKDRKTGKRHENIQWHNLVAWNGVTDIFENHLKKGDRIGIRGRIQYGNFEDKTGNTRRTTKIVVKEVLFL